MGKQSAGNCGHQLLIHVAYVLWYSHMHQPLHVCDGSHAALSRSPCRDMQGWNLEGKDTWIGATDAAAFLRFLGFDAVLVDFSSPEAQSARSEALQVLGQLQAARSAGQESVAANLESSLHALWVHAGCALPRCSILPLPRLRCCAASAHAVFIHMHGPHAYEHAWSASCCGTYGCKPQCAHDS